MYYNSNVIIFNTGDVQRDTTSGNEQTIQVEEIIIHPKYHEPTEYNNDIALVKLSQPARLDQYVQTACLPEENEEVPVGTKCFISGNVLLSKANEF